MRRSQTDATGQNGSSSGQGSSFGRPDDSFIPPITGTQPFQGWWLIRDLSPRVGLTANPGLWDGTPIGVHRMNGVKIPGFRGGRSRAAPIRVHRMNEVKALGFTSSRDLRDRQTLANGIRPRPDLLAHWSLEITPKSGWSRKAQTATEHHFTMAWSNIAEVATGAPRRRANRRRTRGKPLRRLEQNHPTSDFGLNSQPSDESPPAAQPPLAAKTS